MAFLVAFFDEYRKDQIGLFHLAGVLGLDAAFSLIPPGFQPISDFTAMATLPVPEVFRWFPGEFAAALGGGLGRRWAR